jgi:chromosome segregation ATPase
MTRLKPIVTQEGFEVYDLSELSPEQLTQVIGEHVGEDIPNMTTEDRHYTDEQAQANHPVPAPIEPKKDVWDNPVLNTFKNAFGDMANAVVERTTLAERVAVLERQLDQTTMANVSLVNERDSLKAENGNLSDQVRSLKLELEQRDATLEYTRQNLVRALRSKDETQTELDDAKRQIHTLKDDAELAQMERDEWMNRYNNENASHKLTNESYDNAKKSWYEQEEQLAKVIDELTTKVERLERKWTRAKAMAAETMQLARDE